MPVASWQPPGCRLVASWTREEQVIDAPRDAPIARGYSAAVRVVVTGLIATYPVGGVTWDYLQYVHGLAALGHDVTYLEDTGQWVYSPRLQTFTEACADNLAYLDRVLGAGEASVPW